MNLFRQLPPWLLLVLCVLYLVSPVDLLPDFLGLTGRVDDLLVAIGTLFYIYSTSKRKQQKDGSRKEGSGRESQQDHQGRRGSEGASSGRPTRERQDPYAVLGASRTEDLDEIRRLYKEKLLQYHPDRVEHLGKELQEMAERKTKEITEAYRRILRERGVRP
jgi:DnaJ domain/Protein of unknown function (DUF1232)